MIPGTDIEDDVPLAPRTTLGLGGTARFYLTARDAGSVAQAIRWARHRGVPVAILGGGSNLVVPDHGFDGLVIEMAQRGIEDLGGGVTRAAAGEEWDGFVARAVAQDLAGIECLAGIPGRVGATPIQNVGAYGQEVAETIREVEVLERRTLSRAVIRGEECGFGYRDSDFKRDPDTYVVLSVTFALRPGGAPSVRYLELERAMEGRDASLSDVMQTVLALRRAKSMVIDFADPNHRSAGSFFTNPIVSSDLADRVEGAPRWPMPDGRVKLAAGWLIEQAGFQKGLVRGAVGLSTKHALALVHHGGGTAEALLALAEEIRAGVAARFGVTLELEPRILSAPVDPDGARST
ncbi:MAG: UDP-N-acetylmuramate dehydrogenase [Sandaracinaceae bacterium]